MKTVKLVLTCLLIAIPCQARTITVDVDGPADFNNIQAAINDANDGDIIIVADGTYTGDGNRDIDFSGKAITLRSQNGPENCIIDCNGSEAEPHRGFHFHSGEDSNSILDGLTITNGYASGSGRENWGGGIYCENSSPTIINCAIIENTNGGGIHCYESDPNITNCAITGNIGSGIACTSLSNGSNAMITNCTITGNIGGGIFCYVSDPSITNCTISENTAVSWGGGIFCLAGSPKITSCTITGNSVESAGYYRGGGGISGVGASRPTMVNCTFSANTATYGGAILCDEYSHPLLLNCILWGNNATYGPEIAMDSGDWGSSLSISYSNLKGGQAGIYDVDKLYWGPGNIDTDPCFSDPCSGDYHLKSQAGRWDPNSESWVTDANTNLCIDAGDMASPVGYEPFPNGGIINMGAYGGTGEASKSYFGSPVCETVVAGDINGDCIVDWKDFAFMALHWLEDNNP